MAKNHIPHRIGKHVIDLHLSDEKDARTFQDEISRIYNRQVTEVLEEVLEEFSQEGEYLRLDRLVVDLGEVSAEHFSAEFLHRLRFGLRNALAAEIRRLPISEGLIGNQPSIRISLNRSKVEQLRHWLQFGYWGAWGKEPGQSSAELLQELMESQPEMLRQLLQEEGQAKRIRLRLVNQLPFPLAKAVHDFLLPELSPIAQKSLAQIQKQIRLLPGSEIKRIASKEWLLRLGLDYALTASPGQQTTNALFRSLGVALSKLLLEKEEVNEAEAAFQRLTQFPEQALQTAMREGGAQNIGAARKKAGLVSQGRKVDPFTLLQSAERQEARKTSLSMNSRLSQSREPATPISQGQVVSVEWLSTEGWRDLLWSYWASGKLPWWTPEPLQRETGSSLLLHLFESGRAKLESLLLDIKDRNIPVEVRQRISRELYQHLSEAQRFQLLEHLEPNFSGFVFSLSRAFIQYGIAIEQAPQPSEQRFWEGFWSWWLDLEEEAFSATRMGEALLEELAIHWKQTLPTLRKELQRWVSGRIQQGEKRLIPLQSILMSAPSLLFPPEEKEVQQPSAELPAEEINSPNRETKKKQEERTTIENLEAEARGKEQPSLLEGGKEENLPVPDAEQLAGEQSLPQVSETEKENIAADRLAKPLVESQTSGAETDPGETEQEDVSGKLLEENALQTEEIPPEEKPDWMSELPRELREALQATHQLSPAQSKRLAQLLHQLSYFLQHGSLPADSISLGLSGPADWTALIEEVVSTIPRPVGLMLNNLLLYPPIRHRFAHQWNDAEFLLLLQQLPQLSGSDFFRFAQDVLQFAKQFPDQMPARLVREQVLIYVLSLQSRSPVPYRMFQRLIRYLHVNRVVEASELLTSLEHAIPDLKLQQTADWQAFIRLMQADLAEKPMLTRPKPIEEENRTGPLPKHGDLPITIPNAGIVLIWPFLPHYFKMLEMLTPGRLFKSEELAVRAVHLVQYLVDKRTDVPETFLTLNKLLCGVPLASPIVGQIDATDQEKELGESLLGAALKQWGAMKNASPDGLRGSFLIREGTLEKKPKSWEVAVEKKPYDLLLDRLPWGLSVVKFPWMPEVLNVHWR